MLSSPLGAVYVAGDTCGFRVWAPSAGAVDLHFVAPHERTVAMKRDARGYFTATVHGVQPGSRYFCRVDGRDLPDPASRFQPEGVHGPSEVVDHSFVWEDSTWHGLPLSKYILYELHVGALTPDGTFDAIIPRLRELKELGVTAIEIMPVAQFPGSRNWGYDGVNLYAVQNSYGGPEGLKRLVNACHQHGLAAVLDVVYNHIGPEGNYLTSFGPYFTSRYVTPWGMALNFDGPDSDEVRRFFIENALYWITDFHFDALRLDAVHAIMDHSAQPFLCELSQAVTARADELNRRVYAIAESDLNDVRIIAPEELGGFGLHSQWNDDFHHALQALLTGDRDGYYQDFGELHHLVKAYRTGYVYTGEYSAFRLRRHGSNCRSLPARQFIVFSQNHDQVGNRMLGERLPELVSFSALKLAAGAVLLSPFIPLLFMGEEYGETAPFLYFVSHGDEQLIDAVRRGRKEEFACFAWRGEAPDPQAETTFERSKLRWEADRDGKHRVLREFYRELIRLRTSHPALALLSKDHLEAQGYEKSSVLYVRRWNGGQEAVCAFHFGNERSEVSLPIPVGRWTKLIDSADTRWCGGGSSIAEQIESPGEMTVTMEPQALVVFSRIEE